MKRFFLSVVAAALAVAPVFSRSQEELKPRLVVCTDIAPADVEPDDMESMVRLMAYADCFEIEALITSVGWNCDPYPLEWSQYLYRVIGAYAKDVPNLMKRSGQKKHLPIKKENGSQRMGYWPSAEYLTSRAVMGSMYGGIRSIGEKNDSPGSELLIRLADEDDPRPIYVAAWGGANTLAQAIWRVKQTRTVDEVSHFVKKFRIYTITDQDMDYAHRMDRARSSHKWLRQEFKDDLLFVWDEGTWQEQCELGKRHWQEHATHIQTKGALGKEYPNYKWGVEGDTPSFLYVLPNGLNDPEDPRQAGWAGYHERGLCADSLTTAWTSWQDPVRSVSVAYKTRFYPDELHDFMARMQWAGEGHGNRNPKVVVGDAVVGNASKRYIANDTVVGNASKRYIANDTIVGNASKRYLVSNASERYENKSKSGKLHNAWKRYPPLQRAPLTLTATPGTTLRLDASQSADPDGDRLTFLWWQQPEIGNTKVAIDQPDQSIATIRIPADAAPGDIHIVCEVHDDGPFHLAAYRRIIISIAKD